MITALSSAFSEWTLICMLFIDGVFGYLITKFARYCRLQIPCLFCSRLDRVLGREEGAGFYWDLICSDHKSRISSFNLAVVEETPPSDRNCSCCKENKCGSEQGFSQQLVPIIGFEAAGELELADEPDTDDDCEEDHSKQDLIDSFIHPEPQNITTAEDISCEQLLIHQNSVPILGSEAQLEDDRGSSSNRVSPEDVGNGSAGISSRQAEHGELISFDEDLPSPYASSTHDNFPGKPSATTITAELEKEMPQTASSESQLGSKPDTTDTVSTPKASSLELGDAYKLATSSRVMAVRQLSGKFLKQLSLKDSTQNSEDLKLLLLQFSSSRGIESSSIYDITTRPSLNSDEFKASDSSSTSNRRMSLERNESNISLDGSMVSEIEGESMVDRLKRQVEHDKILLSSLYKELEEERSASAVAANQAMAMITRLQEEKAALQMDALQCLRMMEEQADFDNEALEKANETSVEMEKTIQDLEAKLEAYKIKYGDVTLLTNVEASIESSSAREIDTADMDEISIQNRGNVVGDADEDTIGEMEKPIMRRSPNFDFESEKLYIKRCLMNLEEKLLLFSAMPSSDPAACESSAEEWIKVSNSTEVENREDVQENREIEDSPFQQDAMKEKGHVAERIQLDTLRNELSTLTNRLELLEEEHNLIQHSINSLQNGEEGLKFIVEIAGHLQQLHLRIK